MNLMIANILAAVPEPSVFGLNSQTLFSIALQLWNTGLLAVALTYLLYKPVRKYMLKRSDGIKAQFELAEANMAQANELKEAYEQRLRDIELEKNEIIEAARAFAAEKSAQMLDEAKSEASIIKERAHTDVEREYQQAKDSLEKYIIEVASVMAEKYISNAIDKSTQDRLFAETIAELEEVTWLN